ncbi:MAG: leucyl aminopeptidase [Micrococcales bacterium]
MSAIKFSIAKTPSVKGSLLVLGAVTGKGGVSLNSGSLLTDAQLEAIGVTGKSESIARTLSPAGNALAIVGLGAEQSIDDWRAIGGAIGRGLSGAKALELDLGVPDIEAAVALLEGVALGCYSYSGVESKLKLKQVSLITSLSVSKAALDRVRVLAEAVHLTRDLAATPANELYPAKFAEIAEKAAEKAGLKIEVLDEKQLKREGYGLISAVGMGSARPPRLVKISYAPKGASKHLALVGKGITFDTGGLAVKPLGGMLGMKYDMAGAATVYSSVLAIAALGLPIKVTSFLCLAENMPSATAMRPGDVFKSKSGKTVEVTNPDAEGRLVLADGITAASESHPDLIVDVATLTGAARIALGARYTGLMGSAAGITALEAASERAGEPAWAMPLPKELRASLDSPVADLQNSKVGSTFGGMLVGGWFLSEFVGSKKDGGKLEWAHLDIAGPADNEGAAYGYTPSGPTGVMVRTLMQLAEAMSAE